jgi:hypothetical protein
MDTIHPKYEQSKPERSTFILRHRGSGAEVILPLLGLFLGVLAIPLALTDVPLWWLTLIVAVPLGMVDEVRAARRHSADSSASCASIERSRINPKGAVRDADRRTDRPGLPDYQKFVAEPQLKPAENPTEPPQERPTVIPERASAQ